MSPLGPDDHAADTDLLRRIVAGDSGAIGLLYDRHASVLFPVALRIVRERSEAEDVLHDAFVAVRERAGQFSEERGTAIAWLVTLVRNLSIDRTRRRDRRGAIVRDVLMNEPSARAAGPEQLTAGAEEREKLLRALSTLPDVQRATLEIAFYEGLSYPEIAEREGVPLGTVKSRAARAITTLREALVREGLIGRESDE